VYWQKNFVLYTYGSNVMSDRVQTSAMTIRAVGRTSVVSDDAQEDLRKTL